ncbi:RpiB/LacA/LacB family sugar-phosphate isomerase [Candidatus Uhrbacteria bacterium]|nr:RpiB/LacA/LacB family sugar-phosphate isomerase [Candidatus Uhrbacteria bacterium]
MVLASDHAGYVLKEVIKDFLLSLDFPVEDKGVFSAAMADFPDYVIPAAELVIKSRGKKLGIVFGGTGLGECIAANKVRGIRAALIYDPYTARMSKEHNNANVICLGGRTVTKDPEYAKRLVRIWLETAFSGKGRYHRRLRKIARYESKN